MKTPPGVGTLDLAKTLPLQPAVSPLLSFISCIFVMVPHVFLHRLLGDAPIDELFTLRPLTPCSRTPGLLPLCCIILTFCSSRDVASAVVFHVDFSDFCHVFTLSVICGIAFLCRRLLWARALSGALCCCAHILCSTNFPSTTSSPCRAPPCMVLI